MELISKSHVKDFSWKYQNSWSKEGWCQNWYYSLESNLEQYLTVFFHQKIVIIVNILFV